MTSSTKKIIQKTLKHYDEMIEWAKGQNPRGWVSEWGMYNAIKQYWLGDCCPFCEKFFKPELSFDKQCGGCPLLLRYGRCGVSPANLWEAMHEADTWKTWIRHATRMRQQIESLLEEVKP